MERLVGDRITVWMRFLHVLAGHTNVLAIQDSGETAGQDEGGLFQYG